MADGSESPTVVPSAIEPLRVTAPVAASKASVSIVFPAPECPTRATLRIFSGVSGGAAPFASARRRSEVPRTGPLDGVLAPFDGMDPPGVTSTRAPAGPVLRIGHPGTPGQQGLFHAAAGAAREPVAVRLRSHRPKALPLPFHQLSSSASWCHRKITA